MIELQSIDLNNIVYYKNASFPIEKGVTVIYGENRASGAKDIRRSNGAGKSTIVSSVGNAIYDTVPVSGKAAKRDLVRSMMSPDSAISLKLKVNDVDFVVEKQSVKGKLAYNITKDGTPTQNKDLEYSRSVIRENIFPLSEEEYFTFCHLDSRRPSALRFGSSASRLEFFVNLFRLDDYDELRRLLRQDQQLLKQQQQQILQIEEELATYNDNIEETLASIEKDLSITTAELGDLPEQIQVSQGKLVELRSMLKILPTIEELKSQVTELGSISVPDMIDGAYISDTLVPKLNALKDDLQGRINAQKKLERAYVAYDVFVQEEQKLLESIQENFVNLGTVLGKSINTGDDITEELYKELSKLYETNLTKFNTIKQRRAEINKEIDGIDLTPVAKYSEKAVLENVPSQYHKAVKDGDFSAILNSLTVEINTAKALKSTKEKELQEFSSVFGDKDCQCPLCKSDISEKYATRLIETMEADIKERETAINELELLHKTVTVAQSEKEAYAQYKETNNRYKALVAEYDALVEESEQLKRYAGLSNSTTLVGRYLELVKDKPEKPVGVREDITTLEETLSLVNDAFVSIRVCSSFDKWEMLTSLQDSLDSKIEALENTVLEQREKMVSIQSRLTDLNIQKGKAEEQIRKQKDLVEKKDELSKDQDDLVIYDMLMDAFGQKGLKLLMVQSLAAKLQEKMNSYVSLLFSENFKFEFNAVSNTSFNILVHRHLPNGKILTSDVRDLSGAEGRQFDYLLMLAILPLIPSSRRTNFIFFDEPLVNFDSVARDMFINSFIPALNKIIPSIVIVTPLDDELYENSYVYKAVKENGESKLIREK